MRNVFFPPESNSDFQQHDWCKHQYTHFYCYSLRQHKEHTWRRERRREESNQTECIHTTSHTHTHHTHITCGANELQRFTDLSSRRKRSGNRRTAVKWWNRDIVSAASMPFVFLIFLRWQEYFMTSAVRKLWPLTSVLLLNAESKLMRFYGQGASSYALMLILICKSLKNMTWLLLLLSSPCSPDS